MKKPMDLSAHYAKTMVTDYLAARAYPTKPGSYEWRQVSTDQWQKRNVRMWGGELVTFHRNRDRHDKPVAQLGGEWRKA